MKRGSRNHTDSSLQTNLDHKSSTDFDRNKYGLCDMIGCGGARGDSLIADTISSAASATNVSDSVPTTDFFLNQTSYNGSGRGRGRRNSKNVKKFKRKSSAPDAMDSKRKIDSDETELSSLIASELTKLSIEDREKALEEVHGVVEINEEDPLEMKKLFDQVKEELKRIRYKQAYEKAAFLSNTYVNDPEFLLAFLRADNYNPRPAALRLAEHFKFKLKIFGESTLVRDIMYDDLNDDEKAVLNSGFVQTLPAYDQAGRQIIVCNMSEFLKVGNFMNMIRAMWYLSLRNVQMNTRISKMGIVGVYLAHEMGNVFEKLSQEQFNGAGFMQHALPYKFASVHFCFENNTFGSAIQTTLMMSLGKYARIRLRSHSGSRLECRYALKSFGIGIDSFETHELLSLSDSVQGVVQRCRELDEFYKKKQNARLLPRANDVLLGRGRPFQLYSGNLALTAVIDRYRKRYALAKKMDKKIITSEIVKKIRESGGRFLKKVNTDNPIHDWEEVDFETSRLKVSHSFRTMSKWHADNDDSWNNGSKGSYDSSVDSTPSIQSEETKSNSLVADSTVSDADARGHADVLNGTSSNKRRKGQ